MPDSQQPKDLDVVTRERLGKLTLALAEGRFRARRPAP